MPSIRVIIATDIHYGFDQGAKLGSKAPALMAQFTKAVARFSPQPDFVVDLGDRVNNKSRDDDRAYMQEVKAAYDRVSAPLYSVIGNHDVKHMSPADNEQIMGAPATSYSMDVGNFHFMFWNPDITYSKTGMSVTQADVDWLKDDLAATTKTAILFSHMPLYNSEVDEPQEEPHDISLRFSFKNAGELRSVLAQSEKVRAVIAGHRHKNHVKELDGICYITQQSMTDQYKDAYNVPAGTWSMMDLEEDKIKIRLYGKAKLRMNGSLVTKYELPIPAAKPEAEPPPPDVPLP